MHWAPRRWTATLEQEQLDFERQQQEQPQRDARPDGQRLKTRFAAPLTADMEARLWAVAQTCRSPLDPLGGPWRLVRARSKALQDRVAGLIQRAKYFQLASLSLQTTATAAEALLLRFKEGMLPMNRAWADAVPDVGPKCDESRKTTSRGRWTKV